MTLREFCSKYGFPVPFTTDKGMVSMIVSCGRDDDARREVTELEDFRVYRWDDPVVWLTRCFTVGQEFRRLFDDATDVTLDASLDRCTTNSDLGRACRETMLAFLPAWENAKTHCPTGGNRVMSAMLYTLEVLNNG